MKKLYHGAICEIHRLASVGSYEIVQLESTSSAEAEMAEIFDFNKERSKREVAELIEEARKHKSNIIDLDLTKLALISLDSYVTTPVSGTQDSISLLVRDKSNKNQGLYGALRLRHLQWLLIRNEIDFMFKKHHAFRKSLRKKKKTKQS